MRTRSLPIFLVFSLPPNASTHTLLAAEPGVTYGVTPIWYSSALPPTCNEGNQTFYYSTFTALGDTQASQGGPLFQLPSFCFPNVTVPPPAASRGPTVELLWLIVGCALSAVGGLLAGIVCGMRHRLSQWRAHAANVQYAYTKALIDSI